ncbi:S1 family peptidase [Spirillospora sp. NPDC052269]
MRRLTAALAAGAALVAMAATPGQAMATSPGRAAPAPPSGQGEASRQKAVIASLQRDLHLSDAQARDRYRVEAESGRTFVRAVRAGLPRESMWIDRTTGRLRANAVSAAESDRFRRAGVLPRTARHSTADLAATKRKLDRFVQGGGKAAGAGGSWHADAATDSVELRVPDDRTARALLDGARLTASDRARIRIVRSPGTPRTHGIISGDDMGPRDRSVCSVGFIARDRQGNNRVLTAGHCTGAYNDWYRDGERIGAQVLADFPGRDFGLVNIADPSLWTPLGGYIKTGGAWLNLFGSWEAPNGATICKYGMTTSWTCGAQVAGQGVTVDYPGQGVVRDLGQADLCSSGGDSGGPLVWDNTYFPDSGHMEAQGVLSGGYDCSRRITYFQPVNPMLQTYGLSLYTNPR